MQDKDEQQRIREKYAAEPGTGHHVERVMGERENALAYGQDGTVERTEAELEALGYKPGQRGGAAEARKAAAEKDTGPGKGDEKAGPRSQPPAERKTQQAAQQTAQPAAPGQKT